MTTKIAYLMGGGSAFKEAMNDFILQSGGHDSNISLLFEGGIGWEKYVPDYTKPYFEEFGNEFNIIIPDKDGKINSKSLSMIDNSSGILIAGGNTKKYHDIYTQEKVKRIVIEKFDDGIPIAGVSAGAMLIMDNCILSPDETGNNSIEIVEGLGLIKGYILGVHFTERNMLNETLEAMREKNVKKAIGIDESACAIFNNGKIAYTLGKSVYELELIDSKNNEFNIREISSL